MLDQSLQSQLLISLSVLSSSFLGSVHCLGMCGPIVMVINKNYLDNVLYHLGRLIGYLLLGLLVGLVGRELIGAFPRSLSALIAPSLMGMTFVIMGFLLIKKRRFHIPLPSKLTLSYNKFVGLQSKGKFPFGTMLIGMCSILLPCGWLYGFVVGAAAVESIQTSMIIMFSFWLGTLPALFFTPVIYEKVIGPLKNKFPFLAAMILILAGIGIILIAGRKVL